MSAFLLQVALAGAPQNGDFEGGDVGWADVSQNTAVVDIVAEGEEAGSFIDVTSLVFPSSSNALLLKNGDFADFTPAIAGSSTFLVTHETVTFQHWDERADIVLRTRFAPEGGIAVVLDTVPPSVGAWSAASTDLAAHCGQTGTFQLSQNGQTTNEYPLTFVDDVDVAGVCAAYVDGDGDGACPSGLDADGDGVCLGDEAFPEGEAGGDCDDTQASIGPTAVDLPFDGIDQDCSGADFEPNCFLDTDGDGFGDLPIEGALGCTGPQEAENDGDCDDGRPEAFPGAVEACNGLDDDCDGAPETDAPYAVWPDDDGDGFGDGSALSVEVCGPTDDGVPNDDDCDDARDFVFPGAGEVPADGLDQDCDGSELCYVDADGDTWGDATEEADLACTGYATRPGDCDDSLPAVNPDGLETCNNLDDDCDGQLDEGFQATLYFPDGDADGFGDDTSPLSSCTDPGEGYVTEAGDCDDADATRNPDAMEGRADGVDQDCDGFETCYVDADEDGYGTLEVGFSPDLTCDEDGLAATNDDCDDENAAIHPGATELAGNAVDEDCDGVLLEAPPPPELVYKGGRCDQSGGRGLFGILVLAGLLTRRRR